MPTPVVETVCFQRGEIKPQRRRHRAENGEKRAENSAE